MSEPDHPAASAVSVSTGIRAWRRVLVMVGVLTLGWGFYVLFDDVRLSRIPGVALWIGAAIVLHDAILSPLVFVAGVVLRRAGMRLGGTIVIVAQGAIVVGSIVSLVVVPIIVAGNFSPRNPTVLPLNYTLNFGVFWLVLIVATSILAAWLYARSRRAKTRPSRSQD